MKRLALVVGLAAFALLLAGTPPAAAAGRIEVNLAPLGRSFSPPPLGRRQGWLTISNRDWFSYSLRVERDKLFLHRGDSGFGGIMIPSGQTMTIALERETYDMYGSNPDRLRVRVREGRTTTLSLEPFGFAGATGLRGVVNDGDRVRNGVLFDGHSHTVIVPQPPIIVAPPPPPPIIINRPPLRPMPPPPPPHRPGFRPPSPPHRPGSRPPPPPSHRPGGRDRDNGWNISFGFGRR